MRVFTITMILACLTASIGAQATQQWSSCETIVGVTNMLAYNNTVDLALSPQISGCNSDQVSGSIMFTVGQDGVTSTNINTLLASVLAAFSSGQRVMFYYDYDSSTSNCYGVIVSNGGNGGQC
jgi:hypothetical protein